MAYVIELKHKLAESCVVMLMKLTVNIVDTFLGNLHGERAPMVYELYGIISRIRRL